MDALLKKPVLSQEIDGGKILDTNDDKIGIEVVCRIRPKFQSEIYAQYNIPIGQGKLDIIETGSDNEAQNQKSFAFSQVYDQQADQIQIHEECLIPLIKDCFEKKKGALVFTYGVTNSGKTYTIIGTNDQPGLLPLTLQTLEQIKSAFLQQQDSVNLFNTNIRITDSPYPGYELKDIVYTFQSLEIYNEEIYDLLPDKVTREKVKLQLKEVQDKKYQVKEATDNIINKDQGFQEIFSRALNNRQMGETTLNISSSRSHTIFKIQVKFIYQNNEFVIEKKTNICIVDLAGSERAKKAETQGAQLTEACNINKSLLVLGKCLKQMRCQNEQDVINRIPFRECKLTRLLCEYFTDENRILMIVNIKLCKDDLDETFKVLHYGALSVNINLLKSKIYDSTISFTQRLLQQQGDKQIKANLSKKITSDQLKKAKLLVQNTTTNMLFQQEVEQQFVNNKVHRIIQLENDLRQQFGAQSEPNCFPKIESDKRLQKSLERIKSESEKIIRQKSNDQGVLGACISEFNYNEIIEEKIKQLNAEDIEEFQENLSSSSLSPRASDTMKSSLRDLTQFYPQLECQMDRPIIEEFIHIGQIIDDQKMQKQDEYQNEITNTPEHKNQSTNTTPFDELKKKIFGSYINQDGQEYQNEREQFRQQILKDLKNSFDEKDKENSAEQINQGLANQAAIKATLLSGRKPVLNVIDEQESEHDDVEQIVTKRSKLAKKKKKKNGKRA